ncbi:MAG: nuclear transport factor 2 family protein [Methanobacterium sp.]|nr:nuclear transport factor 2 family protein [Methanobacterium sp.]
MEATKDIKNAIHGILKKYVQAYADKDPESIMHLFVEDPDLVAIGAGRDEWVKGPEGLKKGFHRDMTQADEIQVDFEDITVSSSGNVAWASAHMSMYAKVGKDDITMFGRLSMVFEERNHEWLITHLHFSVPDEQGEGQSYPV